MARLISLLALLGSTAWAFWYSLWGRGYYAIGGEWLLVATLTIWVLYLTTRKE